MLTHLSLFSGIGGLDLAAEWAGIQTIGQCEWADYPTKVLEKHWPDVPRWRDIRTLTKENFYEKTGTRTVDVISGGFPCQPFSVAGKQRGKEDDRYLWPEMVRIIKELRPTWIVGENVAGIVRMALPDILSELEACEYRTRTFLIPACAVGARHRRYRVAIVANTNNDRKRICRERKNICNKKRNCKKEERGRKFFEHGTWRNGKDVSNTYSTGFKEQCFSEKPDKTRIVDRIYNEGKKKERTMRRTTESELGRVADGIPTGMDRDFLIGHYWDEEPNIPRIATGIKHRNDRLKCLGNAVVPQQFYPVFKAIAEIEEEL